MTPYKICWQMHKWIGIALSAVLINVSVTGLFLLEKKQYEWIQPATRTGQEGTPSDFVSIQRLFDIVAECNHPDFPNIDSIDRIDFRPGKRVYKVRAKTHHAEIQVDAISGQVLNVAARRSDLLEQLHDGSYLGSWMHGKVMPGVAVANIILALSGLYLWLGRRRSRKKRMSALSSPTVT